MRLRCPGQCTVCRAWSERAVCADCLQRYARPQPRCWTCALPLPASAMGHVEARCGACLHTPPPLDRCIAALDYAFPWDGLLRRFKFEQALELRGALADRLDQALSAARTPLPDVLLAVPLSRDRLRERGYNQSLELARVLGRRLGLRAPSRWLLRVRETAPQSALDLAARRGNVKGAFAVEPHHLDRIAGRHIALVDDVMTTGTTLMELARVLRQAGAARVQAWVVARTPE
ncbi:MAG: ComF family protein [Pelomonas sp.]|nr:ComF family protein [Roseateles sp.]